MTVTPKSVLAQSEPTDGKRNDTVYKGYDVV